MFSAYHASGLAFITDDLSAEGLSVLCASARLMTAEKMNTFISLSQSTVHAAVSKKRAVEFLLEPMERPSPERLFGQLRDGELRYCLSVEAREGVSTGISSHDRAATLRALGNSEPHAKLLIKPGHIFPVVAKEGGVLQCFSLVEAALDASILTYQEDACAFAYVLTTEGAPLSGGAVKNLAASQDIPHFLMSQIMRFRLANELLVEKIAEAALPQLGLENARAAVFRTKLFATEHFAITFGPIDPATVIPTRVQVANLFTDVFGGEDTSSRQQLQRAITIIQHRGAGVLLYLRRKAGQDLSSALNGTSPGDHAESMREYGIGSQILRALKVRRVELLTNSQHDLSGVEMFGIQITKQTMLDVPEGRN